MLIRSQDKEILINFNNLPTIKIMGTKGDVIIICSDTCETFAIGNYSTKAKAMKVLDMIQEAYGDSEYTKYVIPEVCKSLSMKPRIKENIAHAGEIGEMLKKGMTFQMPEDSEVEV